MKISIAKTYASASKTREHFRFSNILASCVITLAFGLSFLACRGGEDEPNVPDSYCAYALDSVFVSNGDVYCVGSIAPIDPSDGHPSPNGAVAALWKNGSMEFMHDIPTSSMSSKMSGLFCANGDVYAVGEEWSRYSDVHRTILWKNGVPQYITHESGQYFSPASLFVSGSDVYVVGVVPAGPNNITACPALWKNGECRLLNDGKHDAYPFSVFVSGDDVYVAGVEIEERIIDDHIDARRYGVIWKNGVAQRLSEAGRESVAVSVYVSGDDVYVAGSMVGNKGDDVDAVLWKNGSQQLLERGDRSEGAGASSVFVSGNDVYAAGQVYEYFGIGNDHPAIWKNGIKQALEVRPPKAQ